MSLYKMLTEQREQVLEKCRGKVAQVMASRTSNYQLEQGLPKLYEQLVEVLRISLEDDSADTRSRFVTDTVTASASRQHAQESFRLGYTVAQLIHGYGCVCQGITEYAHENNESITAAEFSQLNLCLDVAIAQAVSEFESLSKEDAGREESLRLGFLSHELRNYLSSAMMAHELIRRGGVAADGATSKVLSNAHQHMKHIIDQAVAEVRLGGERSVERTVIRLVSLISEVESSATTEANAKSVLIQIDADANLSVEADRHLMASAIANLVQNGIKFTKTGGQIWIRAFAEGSDAVIEVEDRCGGLPEDHIERLFEPFVQEDDNRTGLGLGLSIARRAIELNGGQLSARNLPTVGCIFTVRMPACIPATPVEPHV
jgi:signal transduction histidine kinase